MRWKALCVLILSTIYYCEGQLLKCQDGATLSEKFPLCECPDGQFYNALEGKCQDACTYYGGMICGDVNAVCTSDSTNSLEFSCSCSPGYDIKLNESTNVYSCVDKNECSTGEGVCMADANERCVNTEGGYACGCDEDSLRNDNGLCSSINLCKKESGYICDQKCRYDSDEGYVCSCFSEYTWNGTNCVLNDTFTECECDISPYWSFCAMLTNGTKYCEPKPGFHRNTDGVIEDINECTKGNYECPRRSECMNTVGWYECVCWPDYYWDQEMRDCVPETCSPTYALYESFCNDLCSDPLRPECPSNTVCMVDEQNAPSCQCQVWCRMGARQSFSYNISLYTINVIIPYDSYKEAQPNLRYNGHERTLNTKSMEMIFGKGNAEVLSFFYEDLGNRITVIVALSRTISELNDLQKVMMAFCWPLEDEEPSSQEPKCLLPRGTVVLENEITVSFMNDICSTGYTNCVGEHIYCSDHTDSEDIPPGSYKCECREGFVRASGIDEFHCLDINECLDSFGSLCPGNSYCQNEPGYYYCRSFAKELSDYQAELDDAQRDLRSAQKQLDDQKKTTKIIGGIFGGLLGAVIIVFSAYSFYAFKYK